MVLSCIIMGISIRNAQSNVHTWDGGHIRGEKGAELKKKKKKKKRTNGL